jgi:hypothetical protein
MTFVHRGRGYITPIVPPPTLDLFKERVRSAREAKLIRKIRHDTFVNAMWDKAWVPHLKFVDEFMRDRDITF